MSSSFLEVMIDENQNENNHQVSYDSFVEMVS